MPGLRSRPCTAEESWFPTEKDDWVLLADGRLGCVEHQTFETVRLRFPGESVHVYRSQDFFSLGVENISRGFRIQQRFGVDYAHQAISTGEVPQKMEAALRAELGSMVAEGGFLGVQVEFLEAGASSLDYAVLAEFGGLAAARYEILTRAIQRILVDTCSQEGWSIPFTQITVHQG